MPYRQTTRYTAWLAAACSLLCISGCNTVPSQVGSMIAARLPTMLGPADHYDAHVDGSIFELMRGKLRSVRIHGDNVALSPLMHVHAFDASAVDIHANTRTDAIEGIGRTDFHVVMNQNDLDNYMLAAKPDEFRRGARILLNGREITYRDSVGIMSLRTPFSVTGVLLSHPGHPNQMDFVPSSGSLSRLKLPLGLVNAAVSRQNPVVDLSQMTYPVAIRGARVRDGVLLIDGAVNLSSLIGANPATTPPPPARRT